MKPHGTYRIIVINLIIAVAISLIANFAYLLSILIMRQHDSETAPPPPPGEEIVYRGTVRVSPDGYGYLLTPNPKTGETDSIYIAPRYIRWHELKSGHTAAVTARQPRDRAANPTVSQVKEINGVPYDYGQHFNRPSNTFVFSIQLGYYVLLAFVLLSVITYRYRSTVRSRLLGMFYCLALGVVLYFLSPVFHRSGQIVPLFMNSPFLFNATEVLKCSFVVVVVLLYGWTFQLFYQNQEMLLENEQLKNENLKARYTMLVGQINPHFLFNSLNSLAMLVREQKTESALTYIDQLSYTFRYILQNERNTMISLASELEFLNAYKYLLEIRYADKLFFDISVAEECRTMLLPALSIQPLIENAVKHNTISRTSPLHISITAENGTLIVANPIRPKIDPEPGTGIGLSNLSSRWHLLTGQNIEITNDGTTFTVRLPLTDPHKA